MKNKIKYALKSLFHKIDGLHDNCPSCSSKSYVQIGSKEFIKYPTALRYCNDCKVFFRHPTTLEDESKKFYEDEYVQNGLTTDLPSTDSLQGLLNSNFAGSEKDFSNWIHLLEGIADKLKRKIRVLDYGANWGYTVYQMKKLSFVDEAVGYEYSDIRRRYGEANLNVSYIRETEFENNFDVVFSSHVIEHMHNPSLFRGHMDRLLARRGFVIVTCPNGSMSSLLENPNRWKKLWGEVHPNFISDLYLLKQFSDYEGIVFDDSVSDLEDSTHINQLTKPPSSRLPSSCNLIGVFRINAE
tara:strand:- start:1425 stop:2318 length:894 start_codon:yes stop_codon:yes gene_type:complete